VASRFHMKMKRCRRVRLVCVVRHVVGRTRGRQARRLRAAGGQGDHMGRGTRRPRGAARALAAAARQFVEQLEARTLLAAAAGPDGYGYVANTHALEAIDLVQGAAGVVTVMNGQDDTSNAFDLGTN